MKKSEERRILIQSLMEAGIMVDDQMRSALKAGLVEIHRERFREKQRIRRERARKKHEGR